MNLLLNNCSIVPPFLFILASVHFHFLYPNPAQIGVCEHMFKIVLYPDAKFTKCSWFLFRKRPLDWVCLPWSSWDQQGGSCPTLRTTKRENKCLVSNVIFPSHPIYQPQPEAMRTQLAEISTRHLWPLLSVI